ncbi:MAG: hypothetical protein A2452_04165 [Candidatus Firestonebacteria bacterium RIFOXYC2_FULL_39_67]|nr:MAG: hypothetical protein A2536_08980 [Candidatus Firestonebacteria bacterium RIFOXYD2_FULL_39_29]OGF56157.1 MAG: hypothetical protein A2452_04165 [Candidatus Firestonebacteria bacterium RIFOXYC2_FULL_39_67]
MKLNIYVAVISMFLCLNAAFCEEPAVKTDSASAVPFSGGKCSIGVNNLPWLANYIALRGWDKNKSGSELILYMTNLEYDIVKYDVTASAGFEYTWFDRNKLSGINDAFLYSGLGFGSSFSYEKTNYSKYGYIYLHGYFPVGVEHFFLKEIPNLSYSVEARFYISAGYIYSYYQYSSSVSETYALRLAVSPRFYIRWYF